MGLDYFSKQLFIQEKKQRNEVYEKKINMASVSGNPIEVFLGERIDPANYWMFLVSDLDKIHGISKVSFCFLKKHFSQKSFSFLITYIL